MANVDIISVGLVDHKGDRGSVVYYVPTGSTLADILFQAQAFMGTLDSVTGAIIQDASVTLGLTLPGGLKTVAAASHDIEKGANIGFDVADTPYRTTVRVPAVMETLLAGETMILGSGVGQVFSNLVVAGTGGVNPSDKFGADIVGVIEGLVTFRKA